MTHHFTTPDHPEANGRKPQSGEHAYNLMFPLADGGELLIHCGDETVTRFSDEIFARVSALLGRKMPENDEERAL